MQTFHHLLFILWSYSGLNLNNFLSDPSPIIGYACQWLTDSLTDCRLVNLIEVTLACEDANSKLVKVVTVADGNAEDHVGTVCYIFGSWRLVLKLNFCSDFEHKVGQDFEVEVQARFWSWSLFSILPLMFCRGYKVESWSRFWGYLGLVNILNFKF